MPKNICISGLRLGFRVWGLGFKVSGNTLSHADLGLNSGRSGFEGSRVAQMDHVMS